MKRNNIFFVLIFILAFFLRFFYLGKIPNGLYSDEAAYGYNAYSILKTARDEYGQYLPLAFKSFGEYKAPLYIYFLVPFVKLFGLSEFSVRLSSLVLGCGMVIATYLLAKIITRNNHLSLLSAYFVAVSPMALQFNRMAHESNLSVLLILLGCYFFLSSLKKENHLILSLLFFGLSLYAHNDARTIVPFLLIGLMVLYRRFLWQIRKKLFMSVGIFMLISIPLLSIFSTEAFWNRPRYVNFFTDEGMNYEINLSRGEDIKINSVAPFMFHNKVLNSIYTFSENYLKHFSPDFLFFQGDPIQIYNTLGNGILYVVILPFFILGLFFIFRKNIKHKWFIIFMLLLAPLPAALTKFVPSASRSFFLLPVLSLIVSIGMIGVFGYLSRNYSSRLKYSICVSLIFICNVAYYLHFYYFNTPLRYAKEWHYGMREVISKVGVLQDKYQTVWFSKNAWGYIYPLFYFQYPPEKYQTQARLTALNEFGFGWVRSFDKYIFDDFPLDILERKDTLFIGTPGDLFKVRKPLDKIYYPNGEVAFFLADHSSF